MTAIPCPTETPESRRDPRTSIRLDGPCLLIDRLRVTDPDVASAARAAADAGTPLPAWTTAAIAVGARAIALAGPVAGVDQIARRLDGLAAQTEQAAALSATRMQAAVDAAAHPVTGTVAVAVRTALDRLAADVGLLVAGEDAPLRTAVAASLKDATGHAAERVERALAESARGVAAALSPTDPTGPIAGLRAEVRDAGDRTRREIGEQLGEMRTLLAVARDHAALMEKASIKGAAYEEQVLAALQEICAGAGDTLSGTGAETGLIAKAKSGDGLVRIAPGAARGTEALVVVEAKDSRLSSEAWRRELDAGLRNRRAHAGLGVVRGADRMPGGRRRLLILDPTRIVVAWDPAVDADDVLAAAYAIARASAVQAACAGAGDAADRAALDTAVRDAYDALSGFDALDRAASNARRGVDDLAKATAVLRQRLHDHLARGLRLTGTP